MGQALSISARGGGIFSRTKYADKELGVKFDHVVGEQTTRAKALNNSIQRKTEAALYLYGKETSRAQTLAANATQKKRKSDRFVKSNATASSSTLPMWMRGLRCCIIEMAMRLENGDRVVFVVGPG